MEDLGMSKKQQPKQPIQAPVQPVTPPPARKIEAHRQCPICWAGNGGYGVAYSTQGPVRYYKCSKTEVVGASPCGHTWTAVVRMEVIKVEHKTVTTEVRS